MIGILVEWQSCYSLQETIQAGIRQFRNAIHTWDLEPEQCRMHPADLAQLPSRNDVEGLELVPDVDVRSGHLRIVADMVSELQVTQ